MTVGNKQDAENSSYKELAKKFGKEINQGVHMNVLQAGKYENI